MGILLPPACHLLFPLFNTCMVIVDYEWQNKTKFFSAPRTVKREQRHQHHFHWSKSSFWLKQMKRGWSLLSVMEQTVRSDGNYDAHTFVTDIHNDLHNETTTWSIIQIWCFRSIQNCLYNRTSYCLSRILRLNNSCPNLLPLCYRCLARLYMYVCMYVYISKLQKFKSLFLVNGNFPDTIQAGTSSWLDFNFSATWSASRQAKDVWKVSTIGIILHFISLSCPLSSMCLFYPWGKTWGSGKALNLCRDTSDNICQYTSDTQHILNNVFSADQIWQET